MDVAIVVGVVCFGAGMLLNGWWWHQRHTRLKNLYTERVLGAVDAQALDAVKATNVNLWKQVGVLSNHSALLQKFLRDTERVGAGQTIPGSVLHLRVAELHAAYKTFEKEGL